MLGPAVDGIRAYVEEHWLALGNPLPLRWANEDWPDGIDPQKTASPFIEVEVIGGTNLLRGFSSPGNRLFTHAGLIRFYIYAPWNTGMTDPMNTADSLAVFMERVEFAQVGDDQTVRTLDFSTYDNVATDEAGNYAVLMCSVPFDFYYTN